MLKKDLALKHLLFLRKGKKRINVKVLSVLVISMLTAIVSLVSI